jgi:hypothetical protein
VLVPADIVDSKPEADMVATDGLELLHTPPGVMLASVDVDPAQ